MSEQTRGANCPDGALLAALLDGDLPPVERAEVEDHVGRCPSCAEDLEAQGIARAALRAAAAGMAAPAALRGRIRVELRRTERPARLRRWAMAGALAAALALAALFGVGLFGGEGAQTVAAATIARAHTTETMGQLPVMFASSDPAAVARWVQAQTGRSVTVPDYSASGYTLTGVRREALLGDGAVTMVYADGNHRLTCTVVAGEPSLHGFGALPGAPGVHYSWTGGVSVAAWWAPDATYLLAGNIPASAMAQLVTNVAQPY
jgi:anti-sigma factor RsiW